MEPPAGHEAIDRADVLVHTWRCASPAEFLA